MRDTALLTVVTIAVLAACTPPPTTPDPTVTVTQTVEAPPAPAVTVTRATAYTYEDGTTALAVLDDWDTGTLGTGTYRVDPRDQEGEDDPASVAASRLYVLTPDDPTATSDPSADPRDNGWWLDVHVYENQASRIDEEDNSAGFLLTAACETNTPDWSGVEHPNDTVTIQWCPRNELDGDPGTFINVTVAVGAVSIDTSTSVEGVPGSPAANAAYAAMRTLAVTVLADRATQVNDALPAQ